MNPDHDDKNPSMSYDSNREKVHCFSCGKEYDIFDLIRIDYKIRSFPEIFNKACDLFNITFEGETHNMSKIEQKHETPQETKQNQQEYINKSHHLIGETDYPQQRGLTQTTIDHFKLGYDPSFETKGSNGKRCNLESLNNTY